MADSNGKGAEHSADTHLTTIAKIAGDALAGLMRALTERELSGEAVLVLAPPGDEHEALVLQVLLPDADPKERGVQMLEFAVRQIKAGPADKFREMDVDG